MKISKPLAIAGLAGLVLSGIFIVVGVTLGVLYSTGKLSYTIVNDGIHVLCSSNFRSMSVQDVRASGLGEEAQKTRAALIDYECGRNGADTYYQQGFKNYAQSIGVKAE